VLGDSHPNTIVSIHNLAELHSALGDKEKAASLQRQLVSIFEAAGYTDRSTGGDDASFNTSDQMGAVDVQTDPPIMVAPVVTRSSSINGPPPSTSEEEIRRPLPSIDPFASGIHKPSIRRKGGRAS